MNGETDVNTGLMNEEEEQTVEKEDNEKVTLVGKRSFA